MPEIHMSLRGRTAALSDGKKADPVSANVKKLWLRLGVTLGITEDEEQAIFSDEGTKMEDTLSAVISEGRFRLDGESYIPSEAVAQYNHDYGTAYDETIWCCDLSSDVS